MEGENVREILFRYLNNHDTSEAIILTYYEVGINILGNLAPGVVKIEHLPILQQIQAARSDYIIFSTLKSKGVGHNIDTDELLIFHGKFRDLISFLAHNYDHLDFGRYKEKYPKDQMFQLFLLVEENHAKFSNPDGLVGIEQFLDGIEVVDEIFNLAYYVILGEELFEKFSSEFNKANAVIKKLQSELSAGPQSIQ